MRAEGLKISSHLATSVESPMSLGWLGATDPCQMQRLCSAQGTLCLKMCLVAERRGGGPCSVPITLIGAAPLSTGVHHKGGCVFCTLNSNGMRAP